MQSRRTKPLLHALTVFLGFLARAAGAAAADDNLTKPLALASPDSRLQVTFQLDEQGRPTFDAAYQHTQIVRGSLAMEFAGSGLLGEKLKVVAARRASRDEAYAVPVGKTSQARDHHHELIVSLEETTRPRRKLDIAFRAFDDGVAFRYLLPKQEAITEFTLLDEHTRLAFPGDPTARALPLNSYTTSYEKHYESLNVSAIKSNMLVSLPVMLQRAIKSRQADDPKTIWFALTEANLTNYAGMYLSGIDDQPGTLTSKLSPLPNRKDKAKVIGRAPLASPWRVLMIADDPGRLLESNLVFHLSDPPVIEDTSWIKPGKTTFPWWNGYVLEGVDFQPGLNTATHKHYIHFCAEHGIPYHSLDGTDTAWYGGPIVPNAPTDITKAVPEIDLPELLRYAKEKGVRLRLWMHWEALRPQLYEALPLYEKWGIEGIMVDFMDRDDQQMVAFYHEVAKMAARHKLTVTWHGAYKPTGMERTWPNVLSYEGALNQEYNKWDPRGTPPEHNLDIAFVRMLAGPLDYHQGGMRNVLPEKYRPQDKAPPVQGTRGHQLAMYVVYQNHLPMLVDYPAAYRGQPGLDFLVRVPTTWDETRVLHADFGRALVIARRKGNEWYLGGMAARQEQKLSLPLDFLGGGRYTADLYLDDPSDGPTAISRRTETVESSDTLMVMMGGSGGFVARLVPKSADSR